MTWDKTYFNKLKDNFKSHNLNISFNRYCVITFNKNPFNR